ncbi:unnamed protein product (macronuclear) [Paramecium tetraurelia]|uniref:Uncharacterized protein n=1 Tax=Paramecium tetraurelia TaxID=5888 RepID=A0DAX6_PARTE|nr:uncharacterized protein GSPATT00015100001 [Paramecium tetraurelia]CAK80193.1 unnamed protein product [Paramecium tetraurelia]|eukprot:XP_001447590.1 hypothetical protein (macronuclear) [Paramecium tetraurelia strain d4-2]
MKPQKSIIKELKTYEHNLFKSNKEHKKININDFPNLSRKPIEWTDCDQFIKLRQFKCDKRLAINLCQQYKIHRSDQQFFDTIQNVNTENEEYKKIQNCSSFLLRQIRQNQQKKKKLRMDYQESQFDSKMSSILDHSFSKFQRSLDKHIEIENDFQHTFNLKQLTKEQLLRKLQSLNKGLKQNIQTENIQSNESLQKISLPGTFISIHPSLTDKKYSKAQTPTSGLQTQRDTKINFIRTFVKWQLNSKSNRSLQQIKKIKDDQGKFKPSLSKDLHSLRNIGTLTDIVQMQMKHKSKRHKTNHSIIKQISGNG